MHQATQAAVSKFPLARAIENIQVIEPAGRTLDVVRLPNGRTSLVLRVFEEEQKGDVWVAGPRTSAHYKSAAAVARVVIMQFRPGHSAPLLGVAAHTLTDRMVPLRELWGERAGDELFVQLLGAPSGSDVIERLARAAALRTPQTFEPASGHLARRAVRLLEAGEARVETIAEQLGVTARHLRRAFTESVGVGPKDFARTVRLHRALGRAVSSSSSDWSSVATDSGYYDQAHLIADFRQLVGLTPGAFLKRAGRASSLTIEMSHLRLGG